MPQPRPANVSRQAMLSAIPRLQNRIKELRNADPNSIIDRGNAYATALHHKYDATLVDIFGPDTVEYRRFRMNTFDGAPLSPHLPMHEICDGYRRRFAKAAENLEAIISLFEEKLELNVVDLQSKRALDNLHATIKYAATKLFDDGHFANAVQDACKALEAMVQRKSGRADLAGKALMQQVFSVNAPILRCNELSTQSDRDEQEGLMHLFAGAMLGLRNPRVHTFKADTEEAAIECLTFLSMLARAVDTAQRTP
jgi:uncharacterized protein (TIGR02391 family)